MSTRQLTDRLTGSRSAALPWGRLSASMQPGPVTCGLSFAFEAAFVRGRKRPGIPELGLACALLLLVGCSPRPPRSPPPGHASVAKDQAGLDEPVALVAPGEEGLKAREEKAEPNPDRYPTTPVPGRVVAAAGYKMIRVEPGEFKFGKPDSVSDEDAPTRQSVDDPRGCWFSPATPCTIERPFLLGQTEVTAGLWRAVGLKPDPDESLFLTHSINTCPRPSTSDDFPISAIILDFPRHWTFEFLNELSRLEGLEPVYRTEEDAADRHVTHIYWNSEANGYRLPTEAEWEYAARAGQDLIYAGSNVLEEVTTLERRYECRLNGSEYDYTVHPVAQKAPNAWGFHDMSGNVSEAVWRQGAEPDGPRANVCSLAAEVSCDDELKGRYSLYMTTRGGSGLTGPWRATVFVSGETGHHGLRLARNAD